MTGRVLVRKEGDVWAWWCDRCMLSCWTRLGFARALAEATRHRHWVTTKTRTASTTAGERQ